MLSEVAKKWVDALRSGKFKQGRSSLTQKHPDGTLTHCCLGVLCELAVEAGILQPAFEYDELPSDPTPVKRMAYATERGTEYQWLPIEVQKWAGIANERGSCDLGDSGPL